MRNDEVREVYWHQEWLLWTTCLNVLLRNLSLKCCLINIVTSFRSQHSKTSEVTWRFGGFIALWVCGFCCCCVLVFCNIRIFFQRSFWMLFLYCSLYLFHIDSMLSLLYSYKYFGSICWLVLLEGPFLWISVCLLLFIENQFAYTKEKSQLNVRVEADPDTHTMNNS